MAPRGRIATIVVVNDNDASRAASGTTERSGEPLAAGMPGGHGTVEDATTVATPAPTTLGRFNVLRRVGAGGMGVVYAAYDERLDRRVAIKLLHPDRALGSGGRTRLVWEAQAMARLSHPNVVHVYEVGEHEGQIYVVMEFVQGQDLRSWGKPQRPWAEVVEAYAQAGHGLAAAHEAGLVHRDFKPGNVMITEAGRVQVLDFGLARGSDRAEVRAVPVDLDEGGLDAQALTRSGATMGTPAYMAREVLRGAPADARSDQFSFCVSMYESVYGERPYGGAATPASLMRVVSGEVPVRPASQAPAWVYRLIARGLDPDPERRYPSMKALLAELELHRTPKGRPLRWMLAMGVVTATAVGVSWSVTQDRSPCPEDPQLLDEVWGPERRTQVQAAFEAAVGAADINTLATVERVLDDYADRWLQMHHDACLATRVRGEQSERLLDERMACLHRQQRHLGALTRVLSEADRDLVLSAPRAVQTLPALERCADATALQDEVAPPPAAEVEAVAEVRDRLFEVDALFRGGQYNASVQRAREAQEQSRPLTYEPVRVEADRALAAALWRNGDSAAALELMERVYFDALAIDHRDVAIDTAVDLVSLRSRKADYEQATEWSRHGRALLDGLPYEEPRYELVLTQAVGNLARDQGHLDEARAHYEQARKIVESNWGPDSTRLAPVLAQLSTVAIWQGRWADTLAANEESRVLYERAYGPMHPSSIKQRANVGFAMLKSGDVEEAKVVLEQAVADSARTGFTNDASLATALNNVGGVYERMGDTDVARDYFERAYALRHEVLGPEHPLTAHPLNNLGNSYYDDGRLDEAETYYARALKILEAAHGSKHLHVSFPLVGLARIEHDQQRYEQAAQYFARVVEIRTTAGSAPESVAESRLDLAASLWGLPQRRDEALAQAQRALSDAEAAPDTSPDLDTLIADVKRWQADPTTRVRFQ